MGMGCMTHLMSQVLMRDGKVSCLVLMAAHLRLCCFQLSISLLDTQRTLFNLHSG